MRMEGPVVALVLMGFVVVVALLIATSGRKYLSDNVSTGDSAAVEIVRDNVYQLRSCDPEVVAQTATILARSYRILSMTTTSAPCEQLWIVVEPR